MHTTLLFIIILLLLIVLLKINTVEFFSISKKSLMIDTLNDATEILNNLNISFFLACGTALGIIRDGTFINYDHDIDLGIFQWEIKEQDINKIITEFGKKFTLVHKYGTYDNGLELTFRHKQTDIPLDIFLYYKENDYWWSASYGGICDNFKFNKCRYWTSPFKLQKIKFLNKIYNIPPEKYLVESYGNDWKIPKKFSYHDGLINGGYKNLIKE